MRWLVFVCALGACDRVFGLAATAPIDGGDVPFFDVPESFTCPTIGTTPSYYPTLYDANDQNCYTYTISASQNLAMAECYDSGQGEPYAGPPDQPLDPAVGLTDPSAMLIALVISPEGEAFAMYTNQTTGMTEFRTYSLTDGAWMRGVDFLPAATATIVVLSPPSRGPEHHMIYLGGDSHLHEIVGTDGTTWTESGSPIALADLGMNSAEWAALLPDGLRLVAIGGRPGDSAERPLYTDRPTTDGTFRAVDPIDGAPAGVQNVFLTETCDRAYFTGLEHVLYVQQR